MDEKAKPRVAAGLGKGGPSRWHCLEPEGVTDAGDQTHTMVCIVAPYLLPHKRKEGYGTGTATTFQPSR
jgi:hypothetical protein